MVDRFRLEGYFGGFVLLGFIYIDPFRNKSNFGKLNTIICGLNSFRSHYV